MQKINHFYHTIQGWPNQLPWLYQQAVAVAEPEIQSNRPEYITNQRSYFAEIFLHIKVICLIIFNIYIWCHLFQIFCKSVHNKYAI